MISVEDNLLLMYLHAFGEAALDFSVQLLHEFDVKDVANEWPSEALVKTQGQRPLQQLQPLYAMSITAEQRQKCI